MDITFQQFKAEFENFHAQNKELRYGQSLMNKLFEIRPEKHTEIKGTELDCFYLDEKSELTLHYLENNWI